MLVRAPLFDPALGDRAREISALPLINIMRLPVRVGFVLSVYHPCGFSTRHSNSVYGCSHIAAIKPFSSQVSNAWIPHSLLARANARDTRPKTGLLFEIRDGRLSPESGWRMPWPLPTMRTLRSVRS